MSVRSLPSTSTDTFVAPGSTATGVVTLRSALGRLQTLASIALAISVLVLVETYLSWSGLFGKIPRPGAPFDLSWTVGVQIGIAVAAAVAIGVLVVIAVILAILGLLAWRRGVLAVVAASAEFGPSHVEACARARKDHGMTLWMVLGIVLAAIVVSIIFAGVNGTLAVVGVGTLPGVVGSIVTGLATGIVLVAVYYYGTRHLVGLLSVVSTPAEHTLLERGRTLMLAGAVVGVGAAFSSASWAFDVFSVASLAIIVAGTRDLVRAYDLWLAEHLRPPTATWAVGPAVA